MRSRINRDGQPGLSTEYLELFAMVSLVKLLAAGANAARKIARD
jgi:hypothetical protein